jgi:hypothetical protein
MFFRFLEIEESGRKWGDSDRHYILVKGARNYNPGFEGSQTVLDRPSSRGYAYDRN